MPDICPHCGKHTNEPLDYFVTVDCHDGSANVERRHVACGDELRRVVLINRY